MLPLKYTIFAVIATLFNLLFQWLSFELYEGYGAIYVAMFWGTLAGLVVKYIMDKKYIFYHTTKSKKDDAQKFLLYSLMGGFTTLIFWGTEIAFDTLFNSLYAKYLGAVIGLSIGYFIKYSLDKRYVFVNREKLA